MDLIDADGTLAAHIADDAHTQIEQRLDPGVTLSKGHALLVGTNQRNLVVLDLGGVIQVAGIDVTDPDHLDALGDHFRDLGRKMRERRTRPGWVPPATQAPAAPSVERHREVPAGKNKDAQPIPQRRTHRPSAIKDVDLLSLIEAQS